MTDGEMPSFHSHGKLLLTGEYLVLEGALAFAVPTRKGQFLKVSEHPDSDQLSWEAYNFDQSLWFSAIFDKELNVLSTTNHELSDMLGKLLKAAAELNGGAIYKLPGSSVITQLEFPRQWGLGSSSTLISNIAQWLKLDPYQLLEKSFGGSGYDIAVAKAGRSLFFQLKKGKPEIQLQSYNPSFKSDLFFVYLGRKQNSRDEIRTFKSQSGKITAHEIDRISAISEAVANCNQLDAFSQLMLEHEAIIASAIGQKTIKERLFPDYPGFIKSLGAWGGDFIMSAGGDENRGYFKKKGFEVVVEYGEMVLGKVD